VSLEDMGPKHCVDCWEAVHPWNSLIDAELEAWTKETADAATAAAKVGSHRVLCDPFSNACCCFLGTVTIWAVFV